VALHKCRNCDNPRGSLRPGGLCYRCWYWFEYGVVMPEGNRVGSGAAQMSLSAETEAMILRTRLDSPMTSPQIASKRPRKGSR